MLEAFDKRLKFYDKIKKKKKKKKKKLDVSFATIKKSSQITVKPNNTQLRQTQHSVASDLVLHCLPMSYLQTFRQLITYADSLDPEQAQLVRIVLSSKRKINHEKKEIFGVHLILIYDV